MRSKLGSLVVLFLVLLGACGDNLPGPTETPSTTKELTGFAFRMSANSTLTADVNGTITGDAIALTVPSGTAVTALVATFTTTGKTVSVNGTTQTSGMISNDFTNPVTYHVTAEDGSTRDYTVTVTVAAASAKALTAFSFRMANNAGLPADVTATINGTAIAATVPAGTNVTALVATFATTGASVTVGATAQVSGTSPNNFTSPVTYRVTAADSTTADYTVTVTVAANNAKDITAFAFRTVDNAGLAADVTGTINGTAIAATVPFGTNVTALVAQFTTTGQSVKVGATTQVSGTTPNDFTAVVTYIVTAADTTTKNYTVTVTIAPNTAKDITAFSFLSAGNAGLPADVTGTITGTNIALTVPAGTNVTALVATFTTTGMSVAVGATAQVSGTTPNNFTAPVIYRVTAADTTTKDYTVTVTIAPSTAKDITAFSFLSAGNAGLPADVTGTITGTNIALTVPAGTNVTALIATFSTTGSSVAVGAVAQVSGVTPNDFTAPVVYRVTAADTTTKDYTVTVTVAASGAKAITAFAFESADNAGLPADVTGTITGTHIALTVPAGTNVTALVATFATTGMSVSVGGTAQVSGTTPNDFTSPVTYRVTAADSTTADYTVTVTIASAAAKDITAFSFLTTDNPGLAADVNGTITGTDIALTVPAGTNVTALVATFATTGMSVAVGATMQVSGTTANDFTAPVVYRVTAADTTTKDYTVTVTIAASAAKDITAFSFLSADNAGLAADVTGTITGTNIALTVPAGTNVTALVATFATTGMSVAVGATAQTSGMTANDFTNPVTYRVTAADTSTKDYTVTVTIAASSAKDITAFTFESADNSGLPTDVTGTITGNHIALTVPAGTNVTALVATFTTTGASVAVGATAQVSGTTPNNFTSPVTYRVTAADTSTKDYTVTVTIAASSAKDITAFSFLAANNAGLTADVTATIVGTVITANVPTGTNVTALVATFTTTGASVAVGATAQVSGTTANDFTLPVTYTVTAADSSSQAYVVTVVPVAAGACETLTAPANGTVVVSNGGNPPSTATYACDLGYGLEGSATRTCAVATYSGTAPTCPRTFMVARQGNGAAAVGTTSVAVALEERLSTTGAVVRTIALPTAMTGANNPFAFSVTSSTEGHVALSADNRFVTLAGYAAVPGVSGIANTSNLSTDASPTRRVVARVDADGDVDTTTLLVDAFSGNGTTNAGAPRSVTSVDGSAFWVAGSSGTAPGVGGVHYVTLGSSGATTPLLTADSNLSFDAIADGQLYVINGLSISTVGTGIPTTGGHTLTGFIPALGTTRGFAMLDRNPVVTGIDTIYAAIQGTAPTNTVNLRKYTFDGTSWTQATFAPSYIGGLNAFAVAAFPEGTGVRVIVTQTVGNTGFGNTIVSLLDDGSAAPPAILVGAAPAFFGYRGVAPSPTVAP